MIGKGIAKDDQAKERLKPVTMNDIAKRLDVSTVTVSNALSGRDGVGQDMKRKILQEARRMGYLRSMEESRCVTSKEIGKNLYQKRVAVYIGRGKHCLLDRESWRFLDRQMEQEQSIASLILEDDTDAGRFEGVICVGLLPEGRLRELPSVVIGRGTAPIKPGMDYVIPGFYAGASMLVDVLHRQGHRKIAFLGSPAGRQTLAERDEYLGYCRGMMLHGLPASGWEQDVESVVRQGATAVIASKWKQKHLETTGLSRAAFANDWDEPDCLAYCFKWNILFHKALQTLHRKLEQPGLCCGVQTVIGEIRQGKESAEQAPDQAGKERTA